MTEDNDAQRRASAAAQQNVDVFREQPAPTPNSGTPVWELVIADMHARDLVGRKRYGVPLQAHNGRDALQDAYEEDLDRVVYLRQALEERKAEKALQARARVLLHDAAWLLGANSTVSAEKVRAEIEAFLLETAKA